MHHSMAARSDPSEMSVSEKQVVATAVEDCRHATSHRCVQPVVIDSRSVILVSRHRQTMPQVAAAAPVFVIEYQQPLIVDCSTTQHSSVPCHSSSQLTSGTRHKRKRRRKNKVRHETFCTALQYDNKHL